MVSPAQPLSMGGWVGWGGGGGGGGGGKEEVNDHLHHSRSPSGAGLP